METLQKLRALNLRLLLIEDDEIMADALGFVLADFNCIVYKASTLSQAFTKNPADYNAILVDLGLRGEDGLEAVKAYRAKEQCVNAPTPVPIIILTARAAHEEKDRCLAGGADDFASKTLGFSGLSNLLIKHCVTPYEDCKHAQGSARTSA